MDSMFVCRKWKGKSAEDVAIDMPDLKAVLDKTVPQTPVMNGSVVMDDSLSDMDSPTNGYVSSSTEAFIPGTAGSFTGKVCIPDFQ